MKVLAHLMSAILMFSFYSSSSLAKESPPNPKDPEEPTASAVPQSPPGRARPETTPFFPPELLSGSWYDPDRDGEGFHIQALENGNMLVIWFTYPGPTDEESAKQAWVLGLGEYDGSGVYIESAQRVVGPKFGDAYDKDDRIPVDWGSIDIGWYESPNGLVGTVYYDGLDGDGEFEIEQLTKVADPDLDSTLPSGISGAWYDPQTDGQGWFVEILSESSALVYWFTYDDAGNQAWNVGSGSIYGRSIVIEQSLAGTGTGFGAAFSREDVRLLPFAGMTLQFDSCDEGRVRYALRDKEGEGELELQRLSQLASLPCSALPEQTPRDVTIMTNIADPVALRLTSADGGVGDLLVEKDEAGNVVALTGLHTRYPDGSEVVARIDLENDFLDIANMDSGGRMVVSPLENGDLQVSTTDELTGRRESFSIPNPGVGAVASQSRKTYGTDAARVGLETVVPARNTLVSSRVYCGGYPLGGQPDDRNRPRNKESSVWFVLGSRDVATANPEREDFTTRLARRVEGKLVEADLGVYEATLPTGNTELNELKRIALCNDSDKAADLFCGFYSYVQKALDKVCKSCAAVVGGLCSANSNDLEAGLCEAAKDRRLQNFPLPGELDVWVEVNMDPDPARRESSDWAEYRSEPTRLPLIPGERTELPRVDMSGFDPLVIDAKTEGSMVSGEDYRYQVHLACPPASDRIELQQLNLAAPRPRDDCPLDEWGRCTFDLQTEVTWPVDEIALFASGASEPIPGSVKTIQLKPTAPVVANDQTVRVNSCSQDPTWTFEWNDVPTADEYELEVIGPNYRDSVVVVDVIDRVRHQANIDISSWDEMDVREQADWQWRVRARRYTSDSATLLEGPWSEVQSFRVAPCKPYEDVYEGQLSGSYVSSYDFADGSFSCNANLNITADVSASGLTGHDPVIGIKVSSVTGGNDGCDEAANLPLLGWSTDLIVTETSISHQSYPESEFSFKEFLTIGQFSADYSALNVSTVYKYRSKGDSSWVFTIELSGQLNAK